MPPVRFGTRGPAGYLVENRFDDDACGSLVAGGVILGDAAGFLQELLVVAQGHEPRAQLLVVGHRPGGAERHQIAGLLEFFVVGTEGHRKSERRGFERVVNADAEAAADIYSGKIPNNTSNIKREKHSHGTGAYKAFEYI